MSFLIVCGLLLFGCKDKTESTITIRNFSDIYITLNEQSIDYLEGVECYSEIDGDISDQLEIISSNVNLNQLGTYAVTIFCEDSQGNQASATRWVHVIEEEIETINANYPNGIDLSKLDEYTKAEMYESLNEYLLTNLYGGIPLYSQGENRLFSQRVSLYQNSYHPMFSFGEFRSTLLTNDSEILFFNGESGNEENWTWRSSFQSPINSFNYWQNSESDDMMNLINGSLYTYDYDETYRGYLIKDEIADGMPYAVNDEETVWRFSLKNNLKWMFHPDTNFDELSPYYEVLDANDVYESWKLAISNNWFYAISGGNDFISLGVKGVQSYVDGDIDFDEVGISLLDDLTIEIEFLQSKDVRDVINFLSDKHKAIIHMDLYEIYGYDTVMPNQMAYSGIYYLDEYVASDYIRLQKNEQYIYKEDYFITHYLYKYYLNDEDVIEAFESGYLDDCKLKHSISIYDIDLSQSQVKTISGNSIMSIFVNMFKSQEEIQTFEETYDVDLYNDHVEPILAYLDMRKALYASVDRNELTTINSTYVPEYQYLYESYRLDILNTIPMRDYEGNIDVLQKMKSIISQEQAKTYFQQAVDQAIEDGYYQAGEPDKYTIIQLDLVYLDNVYQEEIANYLKHVYENVCVDNHNYVKLEILCTPVSYADYFSEYISLANFDLALGGYSVVITDEGALSKYQTYNDHLHNYNWGIDTTIPAIKVDYIDESGNRKSEYWSYDALLNALVKETRVIDGQLVENS